MKPASQARGAFEVLLAAGIAVLPLVCWPDLAQPFSTPKLWLLGGLAALVLGRVVATKAERVAVGWPWLAWLASIGLTATTASLVSLGALLVRLLPAALYFNAGRCVVRALAAGSLVESGIAVSQSLGADPLRLLGWQAETFLNPRMRVYGTLGNPDFVAAWLCGTAPLLVSLALRNRCWLLGLGLQLAAIAATGSRAATLALPLAALAMGAVTWRTGRLDSSPAAGTTTPRATRWPLWLLAGLLLAAAVPWISNPRPLGATVRGRLYYARVVAGHAGEIPLLGCGAGSFAAQFARWQVDWLRSRGSDEERAFAGDLDHAHNDYLEICVEYGPLGLAALLLLLGWLARAAPRGDGNAGAWGGLVALAAIALVDFPLHRPAESGLFWLLMGLIGASGSRRDDESRRTAE